MAVHQKAAVKITKTKYAINIQLIQCNYLFSSFFSCCSKLFSFLHQLICAPVRDHFSELGFQSVLLFLEQGPEVIPAALQTSCLFLFQPLLMVGWHTNNSKKTNKLVFLWNDSNFSAQKADRKHIRDSTTRLWLWHLWTTHSLKIWENNIVVYCVSGAKKPAIDCASCSTWKDLSSY